MNFKGCMVALVTPMLADGQICWQSYEQMLLRQVEAGSNGIVILGTTGESPVITGKEREKLIKKAAQVIQRRVPLIVGAGSYSTDTAIAHTQQAQALGADAALLICPYYNRPPQQGLYQHFKKVAQSVEIPLILYNHPGRTGVDLLPETAAKLGEICNIVAIKEVSGDMTRIHAYQELHSSLVLLSGDDETAAEFMQRGGAGLISVAANIIPEEMASLCEAAISGDVSIVSEKMSRLSPLFDALTLQSNPIAVKWSAALLGLIPDGIRLPLVPLGEEYRPVLQKALQHAGLPVGVCE